MNNPRKVAIDTIIQVVENKAYSNIILGKNLNNSDLNEKDKALTTEIVYGTIKYKYTIDKILKTFLNKKFDTIDKFILNLLRVSIYQLKYLDKVPEFAAVNEGVELSKKYVSLGASKLVNGVLRNYLRTKEENYYSEDNIFEKLAFQYSYPQWIVKLFINQYGSEVGEQILKGLNERPGMTVRVNTLKGEYEQVFNNLCNNNYCVEEGCVCPEAIRIIKGHSIEKNPLFQEGFITVQDESAMLVAPSMGLEDGMIVLDLCSAPGGKTTHISEIMNNTGRVLAFDIYEHKLELIKENFERLGIKNIELNILDGTVKQDEYLNFAERVLIDVPCSGLGIIRKKPEIKYNKREKELKEIVNIQRKIMSNAASYVKDDGVLVYSTCTLNKEENEKNISWFLKNNPQFNIEPLNFGKLDNMIYHEDGCVTILPNEYMDGFFIAKIRRHK